MPGPKAEGKLAVPENAEPLWAGFRGVKESPFLHGAEDDAGGHKTRPHDFWVCGFVWHLSFVIWNLTNDRKKANEIVGLFKKWGESLDKVERNNI